VKTKLVILNANFMEWDPANRPTAPPNSIKQPVTAQNQRPTEPPVDASPFQATSVPDRETPQVQTPVEPIHSQRPTEPPVNQRPTHPPVNQRPTQPPVNQRPTEPPTGPSPYQQQPAVYPQQLSQSPYPTNQNYNPKMDSDRNP